jgi:hypothetical protein
MQKTNRKQVAFYLNDDLMSFVRGLPRSINLSSIVRVFLSWMKNVSEKSGASSLPALVEKLVATDIKLLDASAPVKNDAKN